MAHVLEFRRAFVREDNLETADLNQLLKRAFMICKEKLEFPQNQFEIARVRKIKSVFESRITRELFDRKLITGDVLLCGIYVSNLLADFTTSNPGSWWAVDYALSDKSEVVRKGGDMCFIICGVFPERGNYRLMDVAYYHNAGASCYSKFYGMAGREIGYYMSRQFDLMADIVQKCMRDIRKSGENC